MAETSRNAANEELGKLKQKINDIETERSDQELKVKKAQADAFEKTNETETMRG